MAVDTTRQSHRGGMRTLGGSSNWDSGRTAVLKTTGKVAWTPRGSGRGQKSPLALPTRSGGLAPVRSRGRGAAPLKTGRL